MDYQYGPAPPRPEYQQPYQPYQPQAPPGRAQSRPPARVEPDLAPKQHVRGRARYYYDTDSESESDFSDSSDDERDDRRVIRRPRSERGRSASRSPPPPRNRKPKKDFSLQNERYTLTKAAKAAAMSAAVEAVRCRSEPGPWNGQKGARCATAAVCGGLIGSLRNGRLRPDSKLPYAEAAVTGFYAVDFLKRVLRQTEYADQTEKLHKEEREEEEERARERESRRRSRSRARSRGVSRSRSRPRRRVEYHEWEASPVRGR